MHQSLKLVLEFERRGVDVERRGGGLTLNFGHVGVKKKKNPLPTTTIFVVYFFSKRSTGPVVFKLTKMLY